MGFKISDGSYRGAMSSRHTTQNCRFSQRVLQHQVRQRFADGHLNFTADMLGVSRSTQSRVDLSETAHDRVQSKDRMPSSRSRMQLIANVQITTAQEVILSY